ncbi:Rne/Rng family ribonuclease [Sphingomonas sp. AX6]|uniref:Rne/Rng family ribonuclease n=1 Tax=Sphingomonas sp. AX6 TaxID=2653171 RepID=UPI0012F00810|nr:ribonuclease E/G [Sphingomonas sp. AX6]VXC62029.1 Ribonuclease E [Sphingomonas sp. AX6]
MTTRMLIDARHREETRVAVVKGNRIEEFDFESAERKQLKGNIYLAKVTRVEPSLQAAFVDYGGNRHGFLAFSEIHPDYYQIPKEDREALLREEAEHAAEEAALRADSDHDDDHHDDDVEVVERLSDEDEVAAGDDFDDEDAEPTEDGEPEEGGDRRRGRGRKKGGSEDPAVEALRQRRLNLRKRYKIQDVIRRRQVLLVQIVKEERGNKGAALTSYLSLAGRYCVLMPNTAHGGGISRKISSASDRKRLKTIMSDLKLPPTMGCIVRTAGLQRTKVEIKRDFDYLARLWDGIREETLKSAAPALVYGDSDLIKRAIRDIYNREIDEVIVEGEDGYRQAKDFMKLLMPSHARKVKQYSDAVPLYQRHHVEDQLAAMYHPVVQLKSGGYLVINPTEALVSIDINSGRSTREHSIEQTATATNLEAAQEIARQLRLRDMAGLVVIDFIDMDHSSNVRKVEKAMKEALKNDRARIQVGRISAFGLMEMSRQRLRTGVLEASTRQCPHCEGTGLVRTASSAGLSALRLIEDEAARGRGSNITLRASQEAAFYVLNNKRADIAEIEERYGVRVEILSDGEVEGARMSVEASGPPPAYAPRFAPVVEEVEEDYPEDIEDEIEEEEAEEAAPSARRERERDDSDGEGGRKRRRRRGRRGRGRDEGETSDGEEREEGQAERQESEVSDDTQDAADNDVAEENGHERGEKRKRRRRGRRGGARRSETASNGDEAGEGADATGEQPVDDAVIAASEPVELAAEEGAAEKPKRARRRPRARAADAEAPATVDAPAETVVEAPVEAEADEKPKPKRTRRKKADVEATTATETPVVEQVVQADEPEAEAPKPKRTRRKKVDAGEPAAMADDDAPKAPARTRKVAATAAVEAPSQAAPAAQAPEPTPSGDTAPTDAGDAESDEDGNPRRGWWQRTFGA